MGAVVYVVVMEVGHQHNCVLGLQEELLQVQAQETVAQAVAMN